MIERWRSSAAQYRSANGIGRTRLRCPGIIAVGSRAACLVGVFLFSACLKSPPDSGDARVGSSRVESKSDRSPPDRIDPRILLERDFKEAPMLAGMVRSGLLEPVADRLPLNPLVVKPMVEIGRYGGEIRRALMNDVIEETAITKTLNDSVMGYERPIPDSLQPNLAERFEYKNGGRSAVFYLRKGVRWSDGYPFTVDDILFWYEDMAFDDNARTVALFPSIWLIDGEPARMTKINDYTLEVSAQKPLGRVLHAFAFDDFAQPKHVLSRFHPRYNPRATYEEFRKRTEQHLLILDPGIPKVCAWRPVEWVRGQRVIFERNPYYWKVDTVGQQLPYADRLIFEIVPHSEIILLKFSNGEIDLMGRYAAPYMVDTLRDIAKRGRITLHTSGPSVPSAFFLNWDAPRPQVRRAMRNLDVRVALSHAINRDEISGILYQGLMEPCGFSLSPQSPYYAEDAYKRFSQYDPELSRSLLEKAGYRDSDGDGFREHPEGGRFELVVDVVGKGGKNDLVTLVADYWEAVGIKVHLNVGTEDIIYPRRLNGTFEVYASGVSAAVDPMGRPNAWAIMTPQTPWWHRNASQDGPQWLRDATRLLQAGMTTVDPDKLREIMIRFRDIYTENVPAIAIGAPSRIWGASARLGNVPEKIVGNDMYRGWGRPVFHEQIFVRRK